MKEKLSKILKGAVIFAFAIYLLVLFKIILFKGVSIKQLITGYHGFHSVNLIPFDTLRTYYGLRNEMLLRAISNTAGNIAVFIPLGYFLPAISRKFNGIKAAIIVSMALSIFFEVFQYMLMVGSSDIDDVILNTLGGVVGYGVYRLISKVSKGELKIVYAMIIIVSLINCTGAYAVAREEFGQYLGLVQTKYVVIGEKNIPVREVDISGFLIAGDSNILQLEGQMKNQNKGIQIVVNNNVAKKETTLNNSKIRINDKTKIFLQENSFKDNVITMVYKSFPRIDLQRLPEDSMIKAWNRGEFAEVVVVNLFGGELGKKEMPKNHKLVLDKNGIPKGEADLYGDYKSIKGDSIYVNKIVHKVVKKNCELMMKTGIEKSFKVDEKTSYIIEKIYDGGARATHEKGTIKDMKKGVSLEVWGEKKNDELYGKIVVIVIVYV